jgi:hypothetical protein
MIRRSLPTIAIALVLPAAALAATTNITQTAQSGQVKATFAFTTTTGKTGFPSYSNQRLTIVDNGATRYSSVVTDPFCGTQCSPADPRAHGHSVQVVDINGTGEPDVILTLYSGGAHCCTIAHVYSPTAQGYSEARQNFADPAYKLKQLGGVYRFVSADARFEYEFTDFADSGVPIQIWGIANGKFVNVTRSYTSLITTDAARWMRAFNSAKTNAGGLLAAWAADEEELGQNTLVQSTLQSALKAGKLKGMLVKNGSAYITLLNKFLVKTGYET